MTSDHIMRRHQFKLKRLNSEIIFFPPGNRNIRVVVNGYDQRDFSGCAPRCFGSSFFHLSPLSSDFPSTSRSLFFLFFTRCCASRRFLSNLFWLVPFFGPIDSFFKSNDPARVCVFAMRFCLFSLVRLSSGIAGAARVGGALSVCS